MNSDDLIKRMMAAGGVDEETARKFLLFLQTTDYAKCPKCGHLFDLEAMYTEEGDDEDYVITTVLNEKTDEVEAWCPDCYEEQP